MSEIQTPWEDNFFSIQKHFSKTCLCRIPGSSPNEEE